MDRNTLARTWAKEAQALAERGLVDCRLCHRREGLAGALQVWRNGVIVFALCESCCAKHQVLITPTERGTEVRAKRRAPYGVRAPGDPP